MDQTDIQHVSDPSAAIAELLCALGERAVLTDPGDCARYASDQSGLTGALPLAVVRPHSTGEVAEVLRLCTKHRLAVVPQGRGGPACPAVAVARTGRLSCPASG